MQSRGRLCTTRTILEGVNRQRLPRGHTGQSVSIGDEGLDLVLRGHLGQRGVDTVQQALGVALGHGNAVRLGGGQLGGGAADDQVGVGVSVLLGHAAVHQNGVHLVIHQLVHQIQHGFQRDGVDALNVVDHVQLGGGGLCAHGLAVEVGQRLVLVSLVGLHQNGGRGIAVIAGGEVGVLQTVGEWPPWRTGPCRSRPCPERSAGC